MDASGIWIARGEGAADVAPPRIDSDMNALIYVLVPSKAPAINMSI